MTDRQGARQFGLRALLVEDEALIAMMIEDMLGDIDIEVVRTAASLDEAVAAAHLPIDCALLDINLKGERSFPAAEILRSKGIPFLFLTGYGEQGTQGTGFDAPVLQKPFTADDLGQALAKILPAPKAVTDAQGNPQGDVAIAEVFDNACRPIFWRPSPAISLSKARSNWLPNRPRTVRGWP